MVRCFLFLLALVLLGSSCAGKKIITTSKAVKDEGAPYHFILGELAIFSNRPAEALREIDKALDDEPLNAYFHYKKAALLGLLGKMPEAENSAERALQLSPGDYAHLVLLGKIYQSQGRMKLAQPLYVKALQLKPDSEEVVLVLMESYLAEKKYHQAIQVVKQWQAKRPEDDAPIFYEASIYENFLKDSPKAEQAYRRVLEMDSDNLRALSALAELYMRSHQRHRAEQVFTEMEKRAPEDVTIQLQLAILYYESKQYEKAIQKFQEVLQEYPNSDRVIYYLGVILENINRDDEALSKFQQVVPRSPFYKDAVLHQAYLHYRNQRGEVATQVLRKGIKEQRNEASFYEYLADLLRQQGALESAAEVLKQGTDRADEKESLHYALGALYERLGRVEESLKEMKKVLGLNPDNPNALNFIGYSYAEQGIHLDEALKMVQKALQLKPNDGYIVDSLGWVFFKQGNLDQAMTLLQRAYQLVPREPAVAEHLGDLWGAKKEQARALKFYNESLVIFKEKKEGDNARDLERLQEKMRRLRLAP